MKRKFIKSIKRKEKDKKEKKKGKKEKDHREKIMKKNKNIRKGKREIFIIPSKNM